MSKIESLWNLSPLKIVVSKKFFTLLDSSETPSLGDVSFRIVGLPVCTVSVFGEKSDSVCGFLAYFCAVLRFLDPPYAPLRELKMAKESNDLADLAKVVPQSNEFSVNRKNRQNVATDDRGTFTDKDKVRHIQTLGNDN